MRYKPTSLTVNGLMILSLKLVKRLLQGEDVWCDFTSILKQKSSFISILIQDEWLLYH